MNLYVQTQELTQLIANLMVEFPELADDEQLRADVFEGETDLHKILTILLDQTREAKTMADAIKVRKQELGERQARFERTEEVRRALIRKLMERADLQKIPLIEATLSLRNVPPAPKVFDEEALPEDCVAYLRRPDMGKIKDRIAAGTMPDGVTMTNGYQSLTIRTK